MYLELGASADFLLPQRWEWSNELMVGQTGFTSRTVSTTTVVTQKRGVKSVGTVSENEAYSSFSLATELMRKQTLNFKWGVGLYSKQQSSKSGYEDYASLDVLARVMYWF